MRHYRSRRMKKQEMPDLDITAFMNLMVILVPFLLITAVFSRITILQLNLPSANTNPVANPIKELQLEVIIRKDSLEIGDRNVGVLNRLEKIQGHYDLVSLSRLIATYKNNFPQKSDVTILSEANTDYDTLVQVMDRLRMTEVLQENEKIQIELFPNISLGDAPALVKVESNGATK